MWGACPLEKEILCLQPSKASDYDCQISTASVQVLQGHKILTWVTGISRMLADPILAPAWEGVSDPVLTSRVETSLFQGNLFSPVSL